MRALNRIRKQKGYSASEMAKAIGISMRYYQQLESGIRKGSVDVWDALEDFLGVNQRILRKDENL